MYEELLYAASRFNRSSGAEHKRPTSNLVKNASYSIEQRKDALRSREPVSTTSYGNLLPSRMVFFVVFRQQAARTWYGCRAEKVQVIVLLPGKCCYSTWTDLVDCMPHSWPKSFNIGRMQISPINATSFDKHRKFTRARHMWLRLGPDWKLVRRQLYTDWPGIHTYDEINDRLFVNPGRNKNILDSKSKVGRYSVKFIQLRSLGILKTKTQQETLKSNKN